MVDQVEALVISEDDTNSLLPAVQHRVDKVDKGEEAGEADKNAGEGEKKAIISQQGWDVDTFALPLEYFRDKCKLPHEGLIPAQIPNSVVSDDMLLATFRKPVKKNGYRMKNCTTIPLDDIMHLCRVLDGQAKPVNLRLTKFLAKGVYAERILGERVNWASFAADKHRGQLNSHLWLGNPAPVGPPHIRELRVYVPPPHLRFNDETVEDAVPDIDPADAVPGFPSPKVEQAQNGSSSDAQVGSSSVIQSPSFPISSRDNVDVVMVRILKGAISESKKRSENLVEELHDSQTTYASLELERKSEEKKFDESTAQIKEEVLVQKQVMLDLAGLKKSKQEEDMQVDSLEDIDDPNEAVLTQIESTEARVRELGLSISRKENQLNASLEAGIAWEDKKAKAKSAMSMIESELSRLASLNSQNETAIEVANCTLNSQREELSVLSKHFVKNRIVLNPRHVPTSIELKSKFFKLSACPVCVLGFHCQNFVPTSCGHSYHPACLVPLLASFDSPPKCLACNEFLHPDWLESWGANFQSPALTSMAQDFGLLTQRTAHEEKLKELYAIRASLLASRREEEQAIWNSRTYKLSKEELDRDVSFVLASNNSRSSREMQHIRPKQIGQDAATLSIDGGKSQVDLSDDSGDEEGRGKQVVLLQPKIEDAVRKVTKKRKSDELPSRKPPTRNATRKEMGTSDQSPSETLQMTMKSLSQVKSPSPKAGKCVGRGRSPKGTKVDSGSAKSSAKTNSSRRKLPMGS